MSKKLFLMLSVFCFLFTIFAIGLAQEEKAEKEEGPEYHYIGAKKCSMCHKKDGTAPTWEKTAHANAWANVDTLKLSDEEKEPCKACHATGVTEKGDFLPHVQCEACHGPGSEYKSMKIMKSRELSIANGLLIPDEETCLSCHNKELAPEKFHADMPEKFDYEKMKEGGIHALPEEE
jgi:RecJ-like exonuclease